MITTQSREGIGAMLGHHGRHIPFLSKVLGPSLRAWSTYAMEMLVILEAVCAYELIY